MNGQELINFRHVYKLTQVDLSYMVGVSVGVISRFERGFGIRKKNLKTLEKFVKSYHISKRRPRNEKKGNKKAFWLFLLALFLCAISFKLGCSYGDIIKNSIDVYVG